MIIIIIIFIRRIEFFILLIYNYSYISYPPKGLQSNIAYIVCCFLPFICEY